MKISVIVPVYKVEKYIAKCIQSLLDQTYENFEALIVDDGSPDNSIQIAKSLVGNDPRFIFLEKENGGQSSARNMGLDYASGDYIAFLDSDDYFSSKTFSVCMSVFCEQPDTDILLFGINVINEYGHINKETKPNLNNYFQKKDILLAEGTIDYSVCNKIFRRFIFKTERFIEGIIYEDKEIMPRLLFKRKLYSIDESLYFYVYRYGSTMHSYSNLSHQSFLKIYSRYKEYLNNLGIYEEYKQYYEKAYINFCFYSEAVKIMKYSMNFKSDMNYFLEKNDPAIINNNKIKEYYSFFSKQRMMYNLISLNPIMLRVLIKKAVYLKGLINNMKFKF